MPRTWKKLEADIRAAMEAQDSARQQLISVVTGQVTTAEDEEMGDDTWHQMLEEWQQENATDHPLCHPTAGDTKARAPPMDLREVELAELAKQSTGADAARLGFGRSGGGGAEAGSMAAPSWKSSRSTLS